MTLDDTFRVLKREPISEIFHIISSRCNENISEDAFQRIVESYGYTLGEFYDYEQLFVKRK